MSQVSPASSPVPSSEQQRQASVMPFVRRLHLQNFRSFRRCEVEFKDITLLVGRNGAGKSNLLDALSFLADALNDSLEHAVDSRGGIQALRYNGASTGETLGIEVDFQLQENEHVRYGFEILPLNDGGFEVNRETFDLWDPEVELTADSSCLYFDRAGGSADGSMSSLPPVSRNRLYLVNAAGVVNYHRAYEAITDMVFYNLSPEAMRNPRGSNGNSLLRRDGGNIASVVDRIWRERPALRDRVLEYLRHVVPEIDVVETIDAGPQKILRFEQRDSSGGVKQLYSDAMSDGTLRALGILVAVMQPGPEFAGIFEKVRLVGLEEPESALHPAATASLMDALREAASHTQVVITTHSPDLLDQLPLDDDANLQLLAVVAKDGESQVAPVDGASLQAIREHLYTAGDLLRMDQLQPDAEDLERQAQTKLFQQGRVLG